MNSNYKFLIYRQVMFDANKQGFRLLRAPQWSKSYKSTVYFWVGSKRQCVKKTVSLTRQRYSQSPHMAGIS